MLDLSFSELLLIALVAVLALDPKDIPAIAKTCRKWWRELRTAVDDVKAGVQDILDESGAEDVKRELEEDAKYIEDEQGNLQRVYDISELMKKDGKKDE